MNDRGKTLMVENKPLYPAKIYADSTLTIQGVSCTRATYRIDGVTQMAYYTDMYGLQFNQVVQLPGIALYYEERVDGVQIKYLADQIKPLRVASHQLNVPAEASELDDRINFTDRIRLVSTSDGFSWKRVITEKENWNELPELDFENIQGKERLARHYNQKVVVIEKHQSNATKSSISNSTSMEMARTLRGQPIKFILLADKSARKYKREGFLSKSNLDIPNQSERFTELNKLPKAFSYIIYDKYGMHYKTYDSELQSDLLMDDIQYLLGPPAVYGKL